MRLRQGTGPAAAARGPACSSRRCPAAGRHQQPTKSTIYTTLCACSSAVALWHCRARCLASSSCLPREETRARTKVSPPRETQQRRAGMQVQGCDARPGACGRAHQGRRWCGRRRWNRRFVDRPLVAHPLAPPSVILPTAPDLRYLPRARVKRPAHARWSSTAPAGRPLYCARWRRARVDWRGAEGTVRQISEKSYNFPRLCSTPAWTQSAPLYVVQSRA